MRQRHNLLIPLLAISLLTFAILFREKSVPLLRYNIAHNSLLQLIPNSLDPLKANDTNTQFVINHLYDGLVKWSLEKGIEPMLAQRWEFSDNKKSIFFDLNRNVVFSDGSLITAQEIVKCLRRVIESPNYFKDHFKNIQSVQVVSDTRIKIDLKNTDPKILFILSGTPALITKIDKKGNFLSSGPFTVEKKQENLISIRARKNYYGLKPTTEFINFKKISANDISKMIQNNEIDDAIIDSSPNIKVRTNNDSWSTINMWATWGIGFDTRNEVAKSKKLRIRLANAFKTSIFVPEIFPYQQLAYGLIPFGLPGSLTEPPPSDNKIKYFNHDLNNIKILEIFIPREVPQKDLIITWLHKYASKTKINYKIVEESFANIILNLGTGKMGAFLLSFNAEYPSPYFYLDSVLSKGPSNYFGSDSKVINDIALRFDPSKEPANNANILKKINLYLVNEALFIPLMHIKHNAWMRNCVSGIEFTPLSEGYFS